MKKVVFLFLLLFFIGCSENKSKTNQQETLKNESIISIKSGNTNLNNGNKFINYDIKGNRKIAFSPTGEENATTRQIGAIAMIRNPYESINIKLLEKKLSKNFLVKCSACHNDYANGVIGPSLLDKNKDEIFSMIKSYKESKKENVLMRELVMKMNDEEIMALAKEIDDFNANLRKKDKE